MNFRLRSILLIALLCVAAPASLFPQTVGQVVNSIVATACTNQFIRSVTATGAGTCATVSLTADVSGVTPAANGGTGVANSGTITTTANLSIGPGQYQAVATNTAASAGNIGQIVSASVAQGSAISLTNNASKTVTSISLTAGEWDVTACTYFVFGATTSISNLIGDISTTDNTLTQSVGGWFSYQSAATVPTNNNPFGQCHGPLRVSLPGTTSYFLIGFSQFTVSTNAVFGAIRATRVH